MTPLLWIIAAAVVYLLIAAIVYLRQERFIFPAWLSRKEAHAVPEGIALTLYAPDGTRLEGFYNKTGSKNLLLWFDGNSDNVNWVVPFLHELPGIDVAGVNYRGYGHSGGQPGEGALFEDALALYDSLSPRYDRVFLLGRSLGTGVAAFVSSQRPVAGMVLLTPYFSIRKLAGIRFPLLPLGFLVRHPFESARYLENNATKAAVLEVIGDRVIPNRHTHQLLEAIANLTLYERIEGCSHGNVIHDERFFPFVRRALESFKSF